MSLIKIFIIVNIIFSLVNLDFKNKIHFRLALILILNLISEIIIFTLLKLNFSIIPYYSIYFILHQSQWLLLIGEFISKRLKNSFLTIILMYVIYSFIDIFIFDGLKILSYNSFIIGALMYIFVFIFINYSALKREEFEFFKSNNFIVLFAPILFFFGLSLMFGFQNYPLLGQEIFKNIELYAFVSYFVNIIYYTLINLYIYKERKLQDA